MNAAWFVTGTDTEIGKTFVTCALLHAARQQGRRAVGMKPVAAGTGPDGRNEDVEALILASDGTADRSDINPYLLAPPIAPHIAAAEAGVSIAAAPIRDALDRLRRDNDVVLVEGVGGFRVPLAGHYDTADLAVDLALPVILVVGLRLGCINHALLTAEAIQARGLTLAGWVANQVDPAMLRLDQNVMALRERLPVPLLGTLPRLPAAAEAARYLRLPG